MLREYRGHGTGSCGNPAGMEFVYAGSPREYFRDLSNEKKLGESVEY